MTYQEYYDILHKEYAETSETYLKLEKGLAETNGFGDFSDIPNYAIAKSSWQVAANNYWGFLTFIKGKDFKPDDIFILN